MGNRTGTQCDGLVQHDGAGARIDDDLGSGDGGFHRQFFEFGDEVDTVIRVAGGLHLDYATVECLGHADAEMCIDGSRDLVCSLEVGGVQAQADAGAFEYRGRYRAFHLGPFGDASYAQVVDGDLAAAGGSAGTGDDQIALGHGVDLAVGTLEWRGNQCATFEGFGIADGRHVDVEGLAGAGKGGKLGCHQHRRHVFHLQLGQLSGRQGESQSAQVVGQALCGVGHLGGLVAGAVKANDQAEAGQLIAANALNGGDFLDAAGPGGRLGQEGEKGQTGERQQLDQLVLPFACRCACRCFHVQSRYWGDPTGSVTPRHNSVDL